MLILSQFHHEFIIITAPSLDLKAASVPLIAQDVCRRKEYYGEDIMDTMFCAGYLDQTSSVDACVLMI